MRWYPKPQTFNPGAGGGGSGTDSVAGPRERVDPGGRGGVPQDRVGRGYGGIATGTDEGLNADRRSALIFRPSPIPPEFAHALGMHCISTSRGRAGGMGRALRCLICTHEHALSGAREAAGDSLAAPHTRPTLPPPPPAPPGQSVESAARPVTPALHSPRHVWAAPQRRSSDATQAPGWCL
eukprot:354744-Chlamydomonas_euryale.AAC.2